MPYKQYCFFDPGIRNGYKKTDPGSGMNIPDHFSESLETVLGLKIFKFFDDPDPGSGIFLTLRSGIEKKSGSGIRNKHPKSFFSESLETVFRVKVFVAESFCF